MVSHSDAVVSQLHCLKAKHLELQDPLSPSLHCPHTTVIIMVTVIR